MRSATVYIYDKPAGSLTKTDAGEYVFRYDQAYFANPALPAMRTVTRRQSISGVQEKTQLLRTRGRFAPVESGGDYILKPVPRNTALHFPNEPTATGLDFFADGHFTPRYEELGFHSSADFIELGRHFGLDERDVRELLARFPARQATVEATIDASALSPEAKALYRAKFQDRLKALAQ